MARKAEGEGGGGGGYSTFIEWPHKIGTCFLYLISLNVKQSLFHEVYQNSYSTIFLGYGRQ